MGQFIRGLIAGLVIGVIIICLVAILAQTFLVN